MKHDLGTLRSVLAQPSVAAWKTGLKMVSTWPNRDEAYAVALPYFEGIITHWPAHVIRPAPQWLIAQMPFQRCDKTPGAHMIQSIALSGEPRTNRSWKPREIIAQGWICATLRRLELTEQKEGGALMEALLTPQADLCGLTHLNLRGCGIEDHAVSLLCQKLTSLRHLDLSFNRLSSGCIARLEASALRSQLETLNLGGNTV